MMHRHGISVALLGILFFALFPILRSSSSRATVVATKNRQSNYLGFDLNEYPGDAALPVLTKDLFVQQLLARTAAGEKQTTLGGKTRTAAGAEIWFSCLFNRPESHTLKNEQRRDKKAMPTANEMGRGETRGIRERHSDFSGH